MNLLVVTGTGTEVGKTIVTAAVGALARDAGQSVAIVKVAQTGVAPDEPGDVDVVRRLTGIDDVHELARFPDALAPATAARRIGSPGVHVDDAVVAVKRLADRNTVLVEGAGGLLVQFNERGETLADLAAAFSAPVLVVAGAGLGTLNAVALTCEALRARDLHCAGVVIGWWPVAPDLATRCNIADLPAYAGAPLIGVLPAGMDVLERGAFLAAARAGLSPALGGTFDFGALRENLG